MPLTGPVRSEWLPDGRRMRIIDYYAYIDKYGRVWPVPAGTITDGATIPMLAWSVVGSPFTGLYRELAPPHDVAYGTLGVAKDDADVMLRDGSLERGCEEWRADAIYEAVRRFGYSAYDAAQRRAADAARTAAVKSCQ